LVPPHRLFAEKPQVNRRIEFLDLTGHLEAWVMGVQIESSTPHRAMGCALGRPGLNGLQVVVTDGDQINGRI